MRKLKDSEGYVLGVRGWQFSDGNEHTQYNLLFNERGSKRVNRLMGIGYRYEWERGVQQAVCVNALPINCACPRCIEGVKSYRPQHPVVHPHCGCGFWAVTEHDNFVYQCHQYGPAMVGIVKGWGRIQWHGDGFRSEFMMPLAVGINPNPLWAFGKPHRKAVKEVAGFYDAEYREWDSLSELFVNLRREAR